MREVLDNPLLSITKHDAFTLRDAVQGVLATGGIGSGKTSGSGAALAAAYLKSGMGGLVLCAKPEEAELWRRYCAKHGRSKHLIELDGWNGGFNVIAYELARQGPAGINAVVECLMRLLEMARAASPSPGRGGESFWEDTTRQILRNSIPILFAATGTVRIGDVLSFVRSAPRTPDEMGDPNWQRESFFFQCYLAAADRIDDATGERSTSYWRNDYAALDQKTRGNVVISLTTALDRFNHGWLQRMFCSDTTLVPELTFHGMIILLNMPALTLNEDGIIGQQLFKYMWQRAVLARNALPPAQQERFVFLWADEAQYFVNSYDAEFLSTCRGSRACVVFLTQSLPTFYAKMGGENARDRVHHLLGNFATKIWHNNSCPETNDWASRTLGRSLQRRANNSTSEGTNENFGANMGEGSNWNRNARSGGFFGMGGGFGSGDDPLWHTDPGSEGGGDNWGRNRGHGRSSNTSWGTAEQMDHIIEPGQFGRMLKTGGPANRNRVSAVWYQAGRRFASGGNALMVEFAQS
jgi:hypothetical protein